MQKHVNKRRLERINQDERINSARFERKQPLQRSSRTHHDLLSPRHIQRQTFALIVLTGTNICCCASWIISDKPDKDEEKRKIPAHVRLLLNRFTDSLCLCGCRTSFFLVLHSDLTQCIKNRQTQTLPDYIFQLLAVLIILNEEERTGR